MSTKLLRYLLIMVFALPGLTACGGGGGGGGSASAGGTGGTGIVSTGVMTKGSIIVNGVRFDDTNANVTIDDTPKLPADLKDGMVVKLRGQINDDRITGTAERVEVENEVRGTVQTHDETASPPTFTVVSQTVFVPEGTFFDNFPSPTPTPADAVAQLFDGISVVEVHGLRNGDGSILATRVELIVGAPGADIDELRGTVKLETLVAGTSFTLQNATTEVTVSFTPATPIVPAGAALTEGALVEVHGNFIVSTFNATRIDIEDAEDDEFRHGAGEEFDFEGLVSGCATPCSGTNESFFVGSQAVETNSNTRFEGGTREDLVDNVKVEAEGHNFNGTALIAEKIEFKRSVIRLQGNVTASGTGTFTLDVAGRSVTIETDSFTSGSVPPVPPACVQVRGQRKLPASPLVVTAGEINLSCGNGDRDLIQAPVEAESSTTITLLGLPPIDISNPTDTPQWVDVNDQPILSLAAFLNAVTPATTNSAGIPVPGTLVKVIFDAANLVGQAEIED